MTITGLLHFKPGFGVTRAHGPCALVRPRSRWNVAHALRVQRGLIIICLLVSLTLVFCVKIFYDTLYYCGPQGVHEVSVGDRVHRLD